MFKTSETTAKLDAALAKVQGEVSAASKDSINPHFRNRYADLASVWDACRSALSKYGVSVTQWPVSSDDGRVHMVTRLAHDGEWMTGEFAVPVSKVDAQGYGSAITYARRYGLSAAVGVVADDDDDGNKASAPAPRHERAPERTEQPTQAPASIAAYPHLTKSRIESEPEASAINNDIVDLVRKSGRDAVVKLIGDLASKMKPPIPPGPYTGELGHFRTLVNDVAVKLKAGV